MRSRSIPADDLLSAYAAGLRRTPVEEKTEHTDRGALETLLQEIADAAGPGTRVQHEPKRVADKGHPMGERGLVGARPLSLIAISRVASAVGAYWWCPDRIGRLKSMALTGQAELFETAQQPDLFGDSRPPSYRPDPDKVRARLYKILGEARAAQRLPWEPPRPLLYRTIFPQLTLWLPDDEGAQLRFEFEAELARLAA